MWNEPRPPGAPRRVWRDHALIGLLAPAAVLEGVLRPELPWQVVALTIALLPTLWWRRSHPLWVVVAGFGATLVARLVLGDDPDSYTGVFLLILPYSLSRWGSGREILAGAAVVLVNVALSMAGPADLAGAFAVVSMALLAGLAVRFRARLRQRERDQVKLLERERLARDLHDTVAHHVSAMAIRAQAGLARAGKDPGAAVEALKVIEAEASRALAEMRTMVRVLRQPADLDPARGVADLAELQRGSGVPVEVEIRGDVGNLQPSTGAAIFRLAQESVTNARRHARHATRIRVVVAACGDAIRLEVTDDGEATAPGATGYGLLGMAERATLLGGTCEAGPNPGRGWTVTAVLPRTA
ncbi:sensor histidine kinase [Herbidospora cretacea]|uniref:sensor histidine kinase n=1 Tax=Herbidospora cretacea TaxID=28444 RepID=UPI0009ED7DBD|nr:sensor histidine kinase [Herbidospora cretacea]